MVPERRSTTAPLALLVWSSVAAKKEFLDKIVGLFTASATTAGGVTIT